VVPANSEAAFRRCLHEVGYLLAPAGTQVTNGRSQEYDPTASRGVVNGPGR